MNSNSLTSNYLMKPLIEWRNGEDDITWMQRETHPYLNGFKVTLTIAGLFCATLLSTIETVVYSLLTLVALTFIWIDDTFYQSMYQKLQSSTFTVLWSLCDQFFNIVLERLYSIEAFARGYTEHLFPNMLRQVDQEYIAEQMQNFSSLNLMGTIVQNSSATEIENLRHAKELITHLLTSLPNFREGIISLDGNAFTQLAYLAVEKAVLDSSQEICFFKEETQAKILSLRDIDTSNITTKLQEIRELSPEAFDHMEPSPNPAVQDFVQKVKTAAGNELRGSLMQAVRSALDELPDEDE